MALSKSKFVNGVKCPMGLWLNENKPEAFDRSVLNESLFENGHVVGEAAKGLFGPYEEVPFDHDLNRMIGRTAELIANKTRVICEASFAKDGLFCSVDLLRTQGGKKVEIYEVKSATRMDDSYYYDVAFQRYVLSLCGFDVVRACLVHLNPTYVRRGGIDLSGLFVIEDITQETFDMCFSVPELVREFEAQIREDEPLVAFGPGCKDCGYWRYCSRDLPCPNVFDVAGMRMSKKLDLYEKGVVSFEDVLHQGRLSGNQKCQVQSALTGEGVIRKEKLKAFWDGLHYPLYFLDFETFMPAIPMFDGDRPYGQQIPFQYSLHYLKEPDGELGHTEFLAEAGCDPREALADRLIRDIPEDACILAYNMGFEKSVIAALAERFPRMSEKLMNIHGRMRNLMTPFQSKDLYLPAMEGSYSIKYVLPALYPGDPTLDYHRLEDVHKGDEASAAYLRMSRMDKDEQEKLRNNLLAYCSLDTYAMVKVWERIREETADDI